VHEKKRIEFSGNAKKSKRARKLWEIKEIDEVRKTKERTAARVYDREFT